MRVLLVNKKNASGAGSRLRNWSWIAHKQGGFFEAADRVIYAALFLVPSWTFKCPGHAELWAIVYGK